MAKVKYLLTYRVRNSPAHIEGERYPRQGHKFTIKSNGDARQDDDNANEHVRQFCEAGHFKAISLHKEVPLKV